MKKITLNIFLGLLITVLSVVVARPSVAQDSTVAASLLPHPSVEQKTAIDIHEWKSRAWAGESNAQWSVESPGRTGNQCVAIRSEKGTDAAWTAPVTVAPNTFYRLSGWIKTEDVQGAVGALLNIQNMQHVKTPAVAGTRDWTEVSTVFRTGRTTELEVNCLFGGWGLSTGQAWYDDVSIEPTKVQNALTASVTVDAEAVTRPYSPMIFGGFLEHFGHQIYGGVFDPVSPLSDENGLRKDVIEALKELNVRVIRWPGGCFASGYHWENGVGKKRKPMDDRVWGVIEPNTFGTDEFVNLCRLIGAEPYICNNAGNGTVEEMRAWVEYCNGSKGGYTRMRQGNGHEEPLSVKFWSIGNENWGDWEIGHKTIEDWRPLVLQAAKAMKAADPRIHLTAAAMTRKEWTLPLLDAAGEYLDYISIHRYWLPLWQENDMPDYMTCIMKSEEPGKVIADCVNLLEESGFRGRVQIAFDEWNLRAWHHPAFPRKAVQDYDDPEIIELIAAREKNLIASQYTMADALFSASFLNACLRHAEDVGMANIAPLVNTRGPLYVYPGGIVKRTHYHTMAMYSNLLGSRVVEADIHAGPLIDGDRFIPVVDGIVTADDTSSIWSIALVNRHPSKEVECTVRIKGMLLEGVHNATILSGDGTDSYNDIEHPDRVAPERTRLTFRKGVGELPPRSLTIIQVSNR